LPSSGATAVESVARRDRSVVLAGLVAITALAWVYTLLLVHGAPHPEAGLLTQPHHRPGSAAELGLGFAMWLAMMVAMMAPTAAPMLLALARLDRARRPDGAPLSPATAFLLGYLLVWAGFSLVAALGQWQLQRLGLPDALGGSWFAVGLLLAAGVYQLTPLKRACLTHCRSPLAFLMTAWRPGARGALRMGLLHGVYCVGCCWALMGLMFVGGAMNLLWCAALAIFMLAEKALPAGRGVSLGAGLVLVAWGVGLLARAS